FVGAVSDKGPLLAPTNSSPVVAGSFQLVDQSGNPVKPSGAVSSLTLSAEGAPGYLTAGETADPLYDATDATPGGGHGRHLRCQQRTRSHEASRGNRVRRPRWSRALGLRSSAGSRAVRAR